ncbi:transcription factor DUO1 [Cornus florida]|uniref:transcription factor DUO1 n=1 Tax=Cornus florida TaxID=4283 RepID=UPI00289641AC|nr:transcription factor DUO1 [Cornus florida]
MMNGKRYHHYHHHVYDEMGEIKKGPWKAEEDEVLINHVKKYGPRDWSSIRSKGLLQRTGKSCRLRWVNKLRPNLKNGVKFSAEEERIVIELQAEFGNKWARIATYLPGRTDNDVKNFWSSRQKRLARILQTPTTSSKLEKNRSAVAVLHHAPSLEAPKFSSSTEEESSSKSQFCSSSHFDNSEMIKMVPLPDLMNPNLLNFDPNLLQLQFTPSEENICNESQPQFPFSVLPPPLQSVLPLSFESQELVTRLEDPNFLDAFGHADASELGSVAHIQLVQPYCGQEGDCQNGGRGENDNPMTPDSFFDDFPADMFDHIEPLPSPSDW